MGIDYGLGLTNVSDVKIEGSVEVIRYGVISQNEVLQAWCEGSEPYYGNPHCPECGAELDSDICDGHECECGYTIDWVGEECYGDEPDYWFIDDGEYKAWSDSYGDIFITKSPYYTVCGFCSPCAPGAGYLTDSGEDCAAFCFGPDFFDDQPPHNIYEVATGRLVCAGRK